MATTPFLIGLAVLAQSPPPATAADSVTLRDGKVILGQVLDSDRRGPLLMIVRRAWADANLPDRAATWRKAEAPAIAKGEAQARDRLAAWRRDRQGVPADGDRITPWLDRELARLKEKGDQSKSPLMLVRLSRTEVKVMARKPATSGRLLRLGWLNGVDGVEAMPTAELSGAMEARGYAPGLETPVSVDALLPVQPMADNAWIMRRAATEAANDPGGRFIRYGTLLMPEPAIGEAPPAGAAIGAAVSTLKDLLGEPQVDPLPARLNDLAASGRVGAIVTRMELAPDLSGVAVQATLWVRAGREGWTPALVRSASARPGDLPADAGAAMADDPQIKAAFGLVDSLGLGELPADLKQRGLNMGAATRIALGRARQALDREINALAIPIDRESPKGR